MLMQTPDFEHQLAQADILYLSGESGQTIVILENQNYRFMVLNGAIQSVLDMNDPQAIVFPHQRILLAELKQLSTEARVLELGLGGGSALRHASYRYPLLNWTCIEQSAEVVNLYWEYFASEHPLERHEIILNESFQWLHTAPENKRFELILCDVYDELQVSLLEACVSRLSPTGVLMVNWLPHLQPQQEDSMQVIDAVIRRHDLIHAQHQVTGFRNQIHRLAKV